ncbi:pyridoxamine 5'-phosphate oxidase family protein [Streptomyces sp. NPDC059176]|uniref:pyridoxamine 5'-phosphate oxidase family protein n=1 Tax=unclassified Streptomyces TaxID=2593676 RepID=UPI0036B9F857
MRAHLGDQLIVERTTTGAARRDGEIVGLHHEDGTPPYDVRWSDTQEVTLVFPGPDARVRHLGHEAGAATGRYPAPDEPAGRSGAPAQPPAGVPNPGDIGRRVASERKRRGLGLEETALRAGVATAYLAYLEEHPADPSPATLISLAAALGTSVSSLRGGGVDRPPDRGTTGALPQLVELGPEECRALLSTHGVGRIAVTTPDGPVVVPVNYDVIDDSIAFRTTPGSVPAAAVGANAAFEVDHVDEATGRGWSVLAVGPARVVTEPDAVRRLAEHAHSAPWAGSGREMWVSIRPARLTGRRITTAVR